MTTQFRLKNPNSSPLKNWISLGKHLEIRHKTIPYYGDLYAYAANNPVRYVNPDGRIYDDPFEKEFVYQVLGEVGVFAYNTTSFKILPNGRRGGSFVNGWIFYEADTFVNPMANDKNTFIHELFHQIQYYQNPLCQIDLIKEFFLNEQKEHKGSIKEYETISFHDGSMYTKPIYDGIPIESFTYQYSPFNLSKYKTLNDLPFYEAQAQFVGDYATLYFDARFGEGLPGYKKYRLRQMAQTMKNSGYEDTEGSKMDFKRYGIKAVIFIFFALFSFISIYCYIPSKEHKKPLLKSIYMDEKNLVTIILDKTNKSKKIGQIHELKIYYREDVSELEENENEIIIKKDVSDYVDKFYENCPYKIEINWFGGHLFLETIFQNGQFTVLKEKYLDRI
jgi:hypothetical protein